MPWESLAGVPRLLLAVLLLVGLVFATGWLMEKNKKARRQKPGMQMDYTAPGRTATDCRGLLLTPAQEDVFRYSFTQHGDGWLFHLQEHRPSQQVLDTLYQLVFYAEQPAAFSVQFVREAFGQREPIVPKELLDQFFEQKLGAQPTAPPPLDRAPGPAV